jgi:hypothetical protein
VAQKHSPRQYIGYSPKDRAIVWRRSTVRANTLAIQWQYTTVFFRSVLRLLVTANVVPSSPILVALIKETLRSSDTSVLSTVTFLNIPRDGILQL